MEIKINVDGQGFNKVKEKIVALPKKTKLIIGGVALALIVFPIFNSVYNNEENQAKRQAEDIANYEFNNMGGVEEGSFKYDAQKAIKVIPQRYVDRVSYYVYGVANEGGEDYGLRVKVIHELEDDTWHEGGTVSVDIPEDGDWSAYE